MPTENRSSNTEMVSFPRELSDDLGELIAHRARVCGGGAFEIWEAICEGFGQAVTQPHPDPIAWMVGTAFWWTKEEAERDAAETGLPIVGLGPMTDAAEVDRLRVELGYMREERDDLSTKLDRFYSRSHGIKNLAAIEELSAQLADRDALRSFADEVVSAAYEGGSFEGGDIQDMAVKHGLLRIESRSEECGEACACRECGFPAECYRKTSLLCASAEPSSPVERDHEIPGTSFQRLNALANQGE